MTKMTKLIIDKIIVKGFAGFSVVAQMARTIKSKDADRK